MKKTLLSLVLFCSMLGSIFAVDFSLRFNPGAAIPLQKYYKPAVNITVQGDVLLFDLLSTGLEGGFLMEKPNKSDFPVNFLYGGLGLGIYHNLFSRFYAAAGGGFGAYTYFFQEGNETERASDLYWRGYGEFGFRFNPTLTLSLNGGFNSYMVKGSKAVISGPVAGISLRINFSTKGSSKNACYATIRQEADVYPLFMQLYKNDPVATIVLTNGESAEIRNVTVSFTAGKYTSSALKSEPIPMLKKMQNATVDLTVDFSSDLLSFAENGMISGNLVIEYELLGKKKTAVQGISLSVSNRNSYIWGDTESLAAYISPDTPEVLEYAKYVAGIARNDLYSGMNRNLQFAAAMFDSLKSSGIVYSGDQTTPYASYHLGSEADYIQYPLQTMDFSSGDLDMANFGSGFTKSRSKAAELIKKINTSDDEDSWYEFIETRYAWDNYPPAIYTGYGDVLPKPTQATVQSLFKAAVTDYINADLSVVIKRARDSGDANRLGLAYVRAGQYTNAKNEFAKGVAKGNVSAMNNLGNVYMIEKNYSAAEKQYKQVLAIEPNNQTALSGLENVRSMLDE